MFEANIKRYAVNVALLGDEHLCRRLYKELTPSAEEEPATWSPARVRPSVALQMKTLNNLVAGCKSRREATLIDTRRRVPRRYTAREHL